MWLKIPTIYYFSRFCGWTGKFFCWSLLWSLVWLLRQDTRMAGLLSPCGFSSFPCLAQHSYAAAGSQKREFQEDELQRAGAYLASACNALAKFLMATPGSRIWIPGCQAHWGPFAEAPASWFLNPLKEWDKGLCGWWAVGWGWRGHRRMFTFLPSS